MITTKDLNDILENKISNEMQKTLIRNNFPPQIAEQMCSFIDGKEKAEHFMRCLNEWMAEQQHQQQFVQQFLQQYNK